MADRLIILGGLIVLVAIIAASVDNSVAILWRKPLPVTASCSDVGPGPSWMELQTMVARHTA